MASRRLLAAGWVPDKQMPLPRTGVKVPVPVKTSEKAEDMLRFDLENERVTIANYRRRVKQADELNEFAIAESLRGILMQEQDHLISLATALGIDPPDAGIAD